MKKIIGLLLVITVVVADQLTKFWAASCLALGYPYSVMPMLNLRLAYNRGAAFSILGNAGGWQRWFFVTVSVVISAVLISWLYKIPRHAKRQTAALSLLLGGALGNLIDRAYSGQVVDFLDFYYGAYHWPTFNIADSAICIGAFLLIVDLHKTNTVQK